MQSSPLKVGLRIKSIRKGLGLNQFDFAKKINATVPAVSNWENGRNLPNSERLKEIADLGNLTVNELLYGSKEDYVKEVVLEYCEESGIPVVEKALKQTILNFTYTSHLRNNFDDYEQIVDFYAFSLMGDIKEVNIQDLYINAMAIKNEFERMIANNEVPDNEQTRGIAEASEKTANEILESMNETDIDKLLKMIEEHTSNN